MNTDQIAQLAKTFSTACKDAVEKSKIQPYTTAPIVLSAVTVLLNMNIGGKGSLWVIV